VVNIQANSHILFRVALFGLENYCAFSFTSLADAKANARSTHRTGQPDLIVMAGGGGPRALGFSLVGVLAGAGRVGKTSHFLVVADSSGEDVDDDSGDSVVDLAGDGVYRCCLKPGGSKELMSSKTAASSKLSMPPLFDDDVDDDDGVVSVVLTSLDEAELSKPGGNKADMSWTCWIWGGLSGTADVVELSLAG